MVIGLGLTLFRWECRFLQRWIYLRATTGISLDSQPVTYDSVPDFEDYGLGCFLLAGVEVYKLK